MGEAGFLEKLAGQRRPGAWMGMLLVGVVGLVALTLLGLAVGNRSKAQFEARIAALRANGEPMTLEDCMKRYPGVAPEHDLKAFTDSLPQSADETAYDIFDKLGPAEAPSQEFREKLEIDFQGSRDLILALREADFADFRVQQSWPRGFKDTLDPVFGRITCAKGLRLDAVYQSESGDGAAAAAAIVKALQVAYMDTGSGLIGAIGSCAVETLTFAAFPRVLNRAPLKEADLRGLSEALSRRFNYMATGLRLERARILWWYENLPTLGPDAQLAAIGNSALPVSWFVPGYRRRLEFVDQWQAYIDAAEPRKGRGLSTLCNLAEAELQKQIAIRNSGFSYFLRRLDPTRHMQNMLEPRVLQATTDYTASTAQHAAFRSAVALERWHLAHGGQYPDSLESLVPEYLAEVPEDPYDGQPIRYRRTPAGYIVYSIGTDRVDNGGIGSRRGEQPGTDLVVSKSSR